MYGLSLKLVGVVVGLLLIGGHVYALLREGAVRRWLTALPRSYKLGVAILSVDFVWVFLLMLNMDWGEFYNLRLPLLALLPVFFILTIRYVDEFLAVRALGIFTLLVATPILEAAFLKPPASRLLVVTLAYVYLVLGMFWIGMPHLLRDQIGWVLRSAMRWKAAVLGGIAYGVVVLFCALVWY